MPPHFASLAEPRLLGGEGLVQRILIAYKSTRVTYLISASRNAHAYCQLAESGCDVIAVSEHWLWPYEADRFLKIHPALLLRSRMMKVSLRILV